MFLNNLRALLIYKSGPFCVTELINYFWSLGSWKRIRIFSSELLL